MAAKKVKSRSGTQWTEADYAAAGYGSIKVRLPLPVIAKLTRLAAKAGLSRAELLQTLVAKL